MSKPKKHKRGDGASDAPPSLFDDLDLLKDTAAAPQPANNTTKPQGGSNLSSAARKNAAESHGGKGPLHELMDSNFLQFASYTICNRAIPTVEDGLKPVQRRIMHALWEKDDGRFIKVANIVGHTMQYHPHGDASIGDALVNLTNKRYLIEGQGNYGNIYTGDPAAATRYIECRLTELARSELFNPKLTDFIPSYDGRNKEPALLPSKLPLLLMLGAEGIAVGLSTSIFPHNFIELLEAQIEIIRNRPFKVLPDFQTGGLMDASEYDDGAGRVKLRAVIERRQQNKLVISALPWGQTTESLISNIEDAIKKKKVPVKQIHDFTAEKVEIELTLNAGTTQDQAVKSLYAFTACEYALTSRPVVLYRNRPREMSVSEILKSCTEQLLELLRRELELRAKELDDLFHAKTLEQIFIEKRIYKLIEEQTTYEDVRQAVMDGFKPYRKKLRREITLDDVERLLQIKIRRISRYDINRNREDIHNVLTEEEEVAKNLKSLRAYATRYIKALIKKYAKLYPR
ncbi:MAG: DNA topoisomerase IV subunit A, partial [Kiritimatiellae bacterium]|nr:DNA topoisomerase IV subunit A [Kiritimatiellia bacterium]